jgi:hypothetical protein
MLKIIIAGSRDFYDYDYLEKALDNVLIYLNVTVKEYQYIEIVSGGATGADQLGEMYASNRGFQIKRFLPDWNKHGKKAGVLRNKQMAEYIDKNGKDKFCVCFWDGESKGTKNMIETADFLHIPTYIFKYKEDKSYGF